MKCSVCDAGKVVSIEKELWMCTNPQCGMAFRADMTPLVSLYQNTAADPRPALPAQTPATSVVCDFHTDENGEVTFTSRTFIPKEKVEETPFDPTAPSFRFALKVHQKRFKNRRRYMYEKQRRNQEAQCSS